MSLSKFNEVETAIVNILKSIPEFANRTYVGYYQAPMEFPRAEVFAERVAAQDQIISGRRLVHMWQFAVVISHVAGDPKEGYEKMKQLFWAFYDKVMLDRTLGVSGVFATPATDSRLEQGLTEDQRYGFRWWVQVSVRIEL